MSTLCELELAGWKSIREARIDFGPINVLIGANGAGKSNLISFFKMLNELVGGHFQQYVGSSGGASSLLHLGSKVTPQAAATLRFTLDEVPNWYHVRLFHGALDALIFAEERVGFHRPGFPEPREEVLGGGHHESVLRARADEGNKTAGLIRSMLARCRCFHFHDTSQTAPMRLPSYVNDNLNLRPDAANLAAMLHLYHERYPVVYRRIVGAVRQLVPSFDAFVLEPQRLDPNRIRLDWRQSDRDYLFGPHQLSDGTLRTIALATLFLQPEEDLPTVIVLDEPELGLHPNAIESIAGLIRSVSHRSQVILATQSVALVDCFAPGEIIVSAARGGASTFERLSADPLEDWLRDYSLGELWQRNVIPAGPLA